MIDTKGYIYFGIKTENENLTIENFNSILSIKPTKFERIFERGRVPKTTNWIYSTDELVNPYCFEVIENFIDALEPYKEEFKKLKLQYPEISMFLEVVLFLGDETPGLSFSRKIISFVHELGAEIDCDIYNSK